MILDKIVAAIAASSMWIASGASSQPIAQVTADVRSPGPAIPKSFLGFSQEYYIVGADTGTRRTNPAFAGLYRTLARSGAGAPVLRIGGGSQDAAYLGGSSSSPPPGGLYRVDRAMLRRVSRFLEATGAKAIVGLNLAANRPQDTRRFAQAVADTFKPGQVLALEIGNEPETYPQRPVGTTKEFARSNAYDRTSYVADLERHLDALRSVRPRLPVAAPLFGTDASGLPIEEVARLDLLTVHRYALSACAKQPGQPDYPTMPILFQEDVRFGPIVPLGEAVKRARARGLGLRMSETNSVACAGARGVSDRFGAALWGVDWLFLNASAGLRGVNFHSSSPYYTPISAVALDKEPFPALVKPLYYGMLVFSEAAPHGARILSSSYESTKVERGAKIHAWATVDKVDRVVRVVLLHRGGAGGTVRVRVPFARGTATVKRLQAPKLDAADGITWGGQSIAVPTRDGRLTGRRIVERVARKGNRFDVRIGENSALMLTVPVGRVTRGR